MKRRLKPQPAIQPCPVLIIGTYGPDGRANLMTASWAGMVSIAPPRLMVSLRPRTHTHGSLMMRREFTAAIPEVPQAGIADTLGLYSGEEFDKFALAGLTEVRSEKVDAPYAEEFRVVLECVLHGTANVGSHTMFVADIAGVLVDDILLQGSDEARLPGMDVLDPLMLSLGTMTYHGATWPRAAAFREGRKSADDLAAAALPEQQEETR